MIVGLRHTGIVVQNLEESLVFYRDYLGFPIARVREERGGYIDTVVAEQDVDLKYVLVSAPDGNLLELLEFRSHALPRQKRRLCDVGISHVAFTVENISELYERLTAQGVAFNSPPQVSPDGKAIVAFCRAPEGTFIELVEMQTDVAMP